MIESSTLSAYVHELVLSPFQTLAHHVDNDPTDSHSKTVTEEDLLQYDHENDHDHSQQQQPHQQQQQQQPRQQQQQQQQPRQQHTTLTAQPRLCDQCSKHWNPTVDDLADLIKSVSQCTSLNLSHLGKLITCPWQSVPLVRIQKDGM